MTTKIYALRERHFVRYIGKTINSLESRLNDHLADARKGINTHKANWIRQMLDRGELPSITLIAKVDGDGNKEEIAWIKYFRDHGIELTNNTEGGEGGNPSRESRKKNSVASIKCWEDPMMRKRVRESVKRYWENPEAKKKHSELIKKRYLENPGLKKKHSEDMKKHFTNPEYRERISASMKRVCSNPEFLKKRTLAIFNGKQAKRKLP